MHGIVIWEMKILKGEIIILKCKVSNRHFRGNCTIGGTSWVTFGIAAKRLISQYVRLCMSDYVCSIMYVRLCMSDYVCPIMYVRLCMSDYVCPIMYVRLCMSDYVCPIMYVRYHSMSDYVCPISQYVRYHSMSDITVCPIFTVCPILYHGWFLELLQLKQFQKPSEL